MSTDCIIEILLNLNYLISPTKHFFDALRLRICRAPFKKAKKKKRNERNQAVGELICRWLGRAFIEGILFRLARSNKCIINSRVFFIYDRVLVAMYDLISA